MTTCQYSLCGKALPPEKKDCKYCDTQCASAAWNMANPEKRRESMRQSRARRTLVGEVKRRKASADWVKRYAAIKAQYGVPGMGIAPNLRPRVRSGKRF